MTSRLLVTCIMPTYNRRSFVPQSIGYFLRQDYELKELIVVDDGTDPVGDLIPADERIRYFRLERRLSLGAKRNFACEQARGEVVAHWDDDDWVAHWRLSYQVACLQRQNADICGLDRVLFFDPLSERAWEYLHPGGKRAWVYGATLCYTKSFWKRSPFPEIDVGEDSRFVWSDPSAKVVPLPDSGFLAALVHSGNTSPKRTGDRCWATSPFERVKERLGDDWMFYAGGFSRAPGSKPAPVSGSSGDEASNQKTTDPVQPPQPSRFDGPVRVSIGVHLTVPDERLLATCSAVENNTALPVELFLLADGAGEPAPAAMSKLAGFCRVGFPVRRGAPACFNLLLREARGEVVVFLESGALPGPGWLEALLLALCDDPRNGLAGPSTNRSWNMQGVFPRATGSTLADTALEAHNRFGNSVRTMEPLYCLADFCYAVRREVVEAIGAADEAYGEGPCWEMDYTVRAVRAGWRAVWAPSAYVYRMPATDERQRRDAVHFPKSRRRYQDKFCALHLRGVTRSYEPHCRGEACREFAPLAEIDLVIPLRDGRQLKAQVALQQGPVLATPPTPSPPPLVSCIMPTRNRRPFVELALRCFDAQDYESRELVIVDDGDDPIEDLVAGHPKVRYLRLDGRLSIGAKRNLACESARGEVVMHWDDDDWYGPRRITAQAEPILSGRGDITGLDARWILSLDTREFWTLSSELHRRMFVGDIHGGTLTYRRSIWGPGTRFREINLAEDAFFLNQAMQRGARLIRVANRDLFVYMRHSCNAWKFDAGRVIGTQGWLRIEPPAGLAISLIPCYQQAMVDSYA
jgi:glycosyltransferase involved in cell wall biosynthesis